MKIEVFGVECPKCNMLEVNVKKVLNELSLNAYVVKITDIDEIVRRGLMSTPALAIDGELAVVGRVPSVAELRDIVKARRSVD